MSTGNLREPRVLVTRPIAETAIRRLAAAARVDLWDSEMPPPHADLVERLRKADAALSMVTDRFDAATIGALPRLHAISNLAVGVDNIDLEAATAAGVAVGHTPDILTETTADLAFALLMAAARRVAEADRYVHAGRWRTWGPRVLLGHDIYGATLGIVGWGAIGRATARRGAGFNMRILYATNPAHEGADGASSQHTAAQTTAGSAGEAFLATAERVPLDRLLRESDFVSLHVPLSAKTRHLISAREFAMMKPGAIVINTARGAVIDQGALTAALRSERLGGAGLDVTEIEPIESDDPLLQMANVVITPHIGSASHTTRLKMAELAVDNLLEVFAGRLPRFCANPSVRLKS